MLEVVNVVSGGDLRQKVDLDKLASDLSAYKIDRKRPGLYIELHDDSPLVIIYRTGKYVITGASAISEARAYKDKLIDMLIEVGMGNLEPSFTIYNLVYKGDLGEGCDLLELLLALGVEQTEYEPEQSPFLVYRPETHDCVITISSSGKLVISGVKDHKVAEDAFLHLKERV